LTVEQTAAIAFSTYVTTWMNRSGVDLVLSLLWLALTWVGGYGATVRASSRTGLFWKPKSTPTLTRSCSVRTQSAYYAVSFFVERLPDSIRTDCWKAMPFQDTFLDDASKIKSRCDNFRMTPKTMIRLLEE
jgi:hypothetical protein